MGGWVFSFLVCTPPSLFYSSSPWGFRFFPDFVIFSVLGHFWREGRVWIYLRIVSRFTDYFGPIHHRRSTKIEIFRLPHPCSVCPDLTLEFLSKKKKVSEFPRPSSPCWPDALDGWPLRRIEIVSLSFMSWTRIQVCHIIIQFWRVIIHVLAYHHTSM